MAVVAKERTGAGSHSGGDDPWAITPELREKLANGKRAYERLQKESMEQVLPCPECGSDSKVVEEVGSYMRSWRRFRCINGHEFLRD